MKTYFVKVLQTYEETYLIETESEKKAVYLSVSDKLKPEKTKLIKSDITEVKKLWNTNTIELLLTQWPVMNYF